MFIALKEGLCNTRPEAPEDPQAPRLEDEIMRVDSFQNIAWETRTHVKGAMFDHILKRALFQKTLLARACVVGAQSHCRHARSCMGSVAN